VRYPAWASAFAEWTSASADGGTLQSSAVQPRHITRAKPALHELQPNYAAKHPVHGMHQGGSEGSKEMDVLSTFSLTNPGP